MIKLAHFIATLFYVGHMRPAPGTWGSFAAIPLALGLHLLGGWVLFFVGLAGMIPLGYWATKIYTQETGDHDPSEVVIDELVGQWIALAPVIVGIAFMGVEWFQLYPGWIAAFFLFRLFDIWKPWLVGRADRRGDAWGVMADDIWAGLFAAVWVVILASVSHGIFMG